MNSCEAFYQIRDSFHKYNFNNNIPESNPSLLDEDTIVAGDCLVEVRDERIVEAAEAALLPRAVDPGEVGEMGVGGYSQHLR